MHKYEVQQQDFFDKQTTRLIKKQTIWESISMKNTVGMCLFNQETKEIEFHNEALDLLMGGTKIRANRSNIENTILRPKKRKIQMATKQTLEKVYKEKEFQQEAIVVDKKP